MQSNSEIKYLIELIKDFPPTKPIEASVALKILSVRYETLEKNLSLIVNSLNKQQTHLLKFPFNKIITKGDYLPASLYHIMLLFHKYLFDGILSNAGKYRKKNDIDNGLVGFGGQNQHVLGTHKFTGTSPVEIPKQLNKTFRLLLSNSKRPIHDGLEFYRRFAHIHPFYDANGRISRLILTIYFQYYNLNVNWRKLEAGGNKTKFIKKLNACHTRANTKSYRKYFNFLYEHF